MVCTGVHKSAFIGTEVCKNVQFVCAHTQTKMTPNGETPVT